MPVSIASEGERKYVNIYQAFGIAAVIALHQSTQSNFYLKKQVLTTKTFFAMTLVANGLSTGDKIRRVSALWPYIDCVQH
jgi:hypothetical protein